jgi:5-formyltetrahydrofolate cyclo-ligase
MNFINTKTQVRADLRNQIRKKRNSLTVEQQNTASHHLNINFFQHINLPENARIGCYLSNDGELDTSLLIQSLWDRSKQVFLPIIHPFNKHNLLFQRYENSSPMKSNRYGILEPKLDCSAVSPVSALDILLLPLVAFDSKGNRMGMGGGFYDRTLARYYREHWSQPRLIGLAHDCQQVSQLPTAAWDVPLQAILTPTTFYQW